MSRPKRSFNPRVVLAGCLLALSLAGCGGDASDPTATIPPDVPSPAATPEEALMPTPTPDPTPTPREDALDDLPQPVRVAVQQAAIEAGVPEEDVRVLSYDERTWPSTALGCPRPGFSYAQVVTDGFEVILEAGGETYEYHTNLSTNVVLCSRSS